MNDGFLVYNDGVPDIEGVTPGTLAGYRITPQGVTWLANHHVGL